MRSPSFFRLIEPLFIGTVIFTISGCASTGPSSAPRGLRLENGIAGYEFLSPETKQRLQSASDPHKAAFDLFCSQGKQRRAVTIEILFPVPSLPSGLPLDTANRLRSEILALARKTVTNSFEYVTRDDDEARSACTVPTNDLGSLMKVLEDNPAPVGTRYGEPVVQGDLFLMRVGDKTILAMDKVASCYGWSTETPGGRAWVRLSDRNHYRTDARDPFGFDQYGTFPRFFRADPPVKFSWRSESCNNMWCDTEVTASPLAPISLQDLMSLRDGYTLLLPKALYWRLFNDNGKVNESDLRQSVSISDAVENHEHLWKGYFREFSTIKEAPSAEPGTEVFEVSLDLNPFCQYGRPLGDLKSR